MSEQFIISYIPGRVNQLGYTKWQLHYRDIMVKAGQEISMPAYNELFFVVDGPASVRITSDYGVYDTSGDYDPHDNVHEHRGEITIMNAAGATQWIKLIQVILVN